jgi:hypothetical protein
MLIPHFKAIAKANALNKDNYKDFTAVEAAVNAVVRDKNITEQSEVDAMAKAIEDAIAALQYKDADYTKVDAAIAKAKLEAAGFKKSTYKKSKKKAGVRSVKDGFLWYWTLPEVEKPIENGQEVTDEDDLPI